VVKMLPALLFFVFQPFPPLGGGREGKMVMVGDCCAAGFQG
jgi:hypothetical protein